MRLIYIYRYVHKLWFPQNGWIDGFAQFFLQYAQKINHYQIWPPTLIILHHKRRGGPRPFHIYLYMSAYLYMPLQENGLIFFQNYFYSMSIYIRIVRKCMVDGRSASWGAWQGHAHFSLYCNNSIMVWYFHLIFFQWLGVLRRMPENYPKNPMLTVWAWQGHALFSVYCNNSIKLYQLINLWSLLTWLSA